MNLLLLFAWCSLGGLLTGWYVGRNDRLAIAIMLTTYLGAFAYTALTLLSVGA